MRVFKILAPLMVVFALCFLGYALMHPEASFPWSNTITYVIYIIYMLLTGISFYLGYNKKHQKNSEEKDNGN